MFALEEMHLWEQASVTQENSARNTLRVSGDLHPERLYTELELPSGQIVQLPTYLLTSPVGQSSETPAEQTYLGEPGELLIPVVEEALEVSKRTVATGKVVLRKTVQAFEQALNETLAVRTFEVDRVALNQTVDAVPPVRQEGAMTIYPVVQERLVLRKELVLIEEIRVTQRDTDVLDTRVVTLHREQIDVERVAAGRRDAGDVQR